MEAASAPPRPSLWRKIHRLPFFDITLVLVLAISLIKDSTLVSTIAIYDLTKQAQAVIAETFLTFELWFTVAGMYLVGTITLSFIVNCMEHRFKMIT